jgi:diguanylate cyclase (GGDEF)-like protein
LTPEPTKKSVFDEVRQREIYALYEFAQAMGTSLDLTDAMAIISAKLSNLVPFSCAALFLFDEETETLRCRFAMGTDAEIVQQIAVRSGEGVTGWVARNRRVLVNARPSADLEASGLAELQTVLQSSLVCPLLSTDRFIGTLSVYHVDAAFYRDDHRRLLDRVSEQTAAVISNCLLFERMQDDALTDPLTGLPNTRFLFRHLARELQRAERLNSQIGLLVIHLDDLRNINRIHGRHIGDRALCEFARVLRAGIRPYDVAVRYKRREFIVVLSGCGSDELEHKRQELKSSIEDLYFESAPDRPLKLRISSGGAVYPNDGSTLEALLVAADSRMDVATQDDTATISGVQDALKAALERYPGEVLRIRLTDIGQLELYSVKTIVMAVTDAATQISLTEAKQQYGEEAETDMEVESSKPPPSPAPTATIPSSLLMHQQGRVAVGSLQLWGIEMNGWMRVWVVLSALWILPNVMLASLWFWNGGLRLYTPPKLTSWTISCSAPALQFQQPLTEAHRRSLDAIVDKMSESRESDTDIQLAVNEYKKRHAELTPLEQKFEFWVPEGDSASDVNCATLDLTAHMFNPKTKEINPPVFARLDWYGPFKKGYDLDAAIASETASRFKASREQRKSTLLLGFSAVAAVPLLLYASGWSVAWIRRGFKRS